MRRILKRTGAVGLVLLALNEVRGLVVVGFVLSSLAQPAHPGDLIGSGLSCGLLLVGC